MMLFFARVIPMAVLFGITWYFSVKLPIADYGTYQLCWLHISLFTVLGSFGLPALLLNKNSLYAFLHHAKTRATVIGGLCIAQAASIIYLLSINSFVTHEALLALIVIIMLQSAALIYEAVYLAQERQSFVLTLNLVYAVVFAGWHYYVVTTGYSLPFLLYGIGVINIIKLIAFIVFLKRGSGSNATDVESKVFYQNWLLLGVNESVGIFSKWIDKLVVFYLVSSADFGYYFNGAYEIPVFGMLISIAGNLLVVSFSKPDATYDGHIKQFKSITSLLSSIVFPLFSFLFFFHRELFTLLFHAKFDNSIPVFLISLMVLPIRITYSAAVLQVKNKSNIILYGSLIDIAVFAVCCVSLYPVGGLLMIPLSLVISTYVQISYYLVQTARIMQRPLLSFFPVPKLLGKLFICFALIGICHYFLPALSVGISMLIGVAITAVMVLTLLFRQFKKERLQEVLN
ncbi:MAG: hypothetical protein JST82_04670 [Bacteroidetes bacterium]|nr:hypothetical protein [Bacteroidota bacterium]